MFREILKILFRSHPSLTPRCITITQGRVWLHAVSHRAQSDSVLYHTGQSPTPLCITQCRVWLRAVSYRAASDSAQYCTGQSLSPCCITQGRVWVRAVSHRAESDSVLYYTVGWVNLYQKFENEKCTVYGKLILPKKMERHLKKKNLATTGLRIRMDLQIFASFLYPTLWRYAVSFT